MNDRFLTFVNSTVVDEIGWKHQIQIIYGIEAVLLSINWFQYLFTLYLLLFFRAMHSNLHILLLLYGGQYFFSMISRLLLVYYQLMGVNESESVLTSLVYIANYTRTICLFIAFSMLPFLVFERCFATCFAGTYENDRHPWIPVLLLSIMLPISILSAIAYIRHWYSIYAHCIILICLNIGGSILLYFIKTYNLALHNTYSTLVHQNQYSLSERYQVSENIKTCHWLSRIQNSILFFNIACASMLILEYLSLDDRFMIILNVSFNIMCTLYAAVVPCVVILYTPEWIRETHRLYDKMCWRNNEQVQQLRTTFGEEMVYSDKNIESKVYFDRLQKDLTKHTMEKLKKKNVRSHSINSEDEVFL